MDTVLEEAAVMAETVVEVSVQMDIAFVQNVVKK
jgi:hypothetical protein